jgi:hypothetical protein
MSNIQEILNHIHSITYKPGWKITAHVRYDMRNCPIIITATFRTLDSARITDEIAIQSELWYQTDDYNCFPNNLTQCIYDLIVGMEQHETNEWFKVNGKQYKPPSH